MKKYLAIFGVLAVLGMSEARTVQRVLKDATTMVALDLNPSTVFCTIQGYGSVQLKVNVPELDEIAHFDHRVVGEGQPCITAGQCIGDNNPDSILAGDKIVAVPMRVILRETLNIDDEAKTCTSTLGEDIISHIKGKNFNHHKGGAAVPVAYEKCIKIQAL